MTGIQWTDETWNPVTGCSKVSPGCAHCYAETVALRFWPTQYPKIPYQTRHSTTGHVVRGERERRFTDVQCHEDRLDQPLRWKKPRKVFVNSMSDLFHEDVPDEFIDQVFAVMALAPQHTFQILTKRADRMRRYLDVLTNGDMRTKDRIDELMNQPTWLSLPSRRSFPRWCYDRWPLPNVWLGVSVENQHFADERIPLLLQTPAAVRFISAEPLLGPVDLYRGGWTFLEPLRPPPGNKNGHDRGLDWVIVGGESGKGARPFDVAWARSIVVQCQAAGVAVFVKQLGADAKTEFGGRFEFRDRKGGDPSEWPEDLRVREFPHA